MMLTNCTIAFPIIGDQRAAYLTKSTGIKHHANVGDNVIAGLGVDIIVEVVWATGHQAMRFRMSR
jgi:hypothetical protein